MTITEWQKEIHDYAVEKGWWTGDRPLGDVLANIHSEISEAWEEYRNGVTLTEVYFTAGGGKPEGFPVELADAVIRILDLCGHLGIDLEAVMTEKHAYNQTRPYRHGGKLA